MCVFFEFQTKRSYSWNFGKSPHPKLLEKGALGTTSLYIYIFHHGRNYQNSRGHADCFAGFCMSLPEVPCEKWAGDHTMVKTCTKTGVSVGSDVGRVIDKHSVHKMFPTNHSLWSYPRILSLYACFNPISWKTNKHVWYTSNILTSITVIPSRNPGWFEGRYPSEFSKKTNQPLKWPLLHSIAPESFVLGAPVLLKPLGTRRSAEKTMPTMRKNMTTTNHMCPMMGYSMHISYLHNSRYYIHVWFPRGSTTSNSFVMSLMLFKGQNAILVWYLQRHATQIQVISCMVHSHDLYIYI